MSDGVLDAPDDIGINYTPGHPNDEQVDETLVENQLGRHPGVDASEDRGKRLLVANQLLKPVGALMRMSGLAALGKACVPCPKASQCFGGTHWSWLRYRRFRDPYQRRKKERSASRSEDLTAR
jgi:hypothetical protein